MACCFQSCVDSGKRTCYSSLYSCKVCGSICACSFIENASRCCNCSLLSKSDTSGFEQSLNESNSVADNDIEVSKASQFTVLDRFLNLFGLVRKCKCESYGFPVGKKAQLDTTKPRILDINGDSGDAKFHRKTLITLHDKSSAPIPQPNLKDEKEGTVNIEKAVVEKAISTTSIVTINAQQVKKKTKKKLKKPKTVSDEIARIKTIDPNDEIDVRCKTKHSLVLNSYIRKNVCVKKASSDEYLISKEKQNSRYCSLKQTCNKLRKKKTSTTSCNAKKKLQQTVLNQPCQQGSRTVKENALESTNVRGMSVKLSNLTNKSSRSKNRTQQKSLMLKNRIPVSCVTSKLKQKGSKHGKECCACLSCSSIASLAACFTPVSSDEVVTSQKLRLRSCCTGIESSSSHTPEMYSGSGCNSRAGAKPMSSMGTPRPLASPKPDGKSRSQNVSQHTFQNSTTNISKRPGRVLPKPSISPCNVHRRATSSSYAIRKPCPVFPRPATCASFSAVENSSLACSGCKTLKKNYEQTFMVPKGPGGCRSCVPYFQEIVLSKQIWSPFDNISNSNTPTTDEEPKKTSSKAEKASPNQSRRISSDYDTKLDFALTKKHPCLRKKGFRSPPAEFMCLLKLKPVKTFRRNNPSAVFATGASTSNTRSQNDEFCSKLLKEEKFKEKQKDKDKQKEKKSPSQENQDAVTEVETGELKENPDEEENSGILNKSSNNVLSNLSSNHKSNNTCKLNKRCNSDLIKYNRCHTNSKSVTKFHETPAPNRCFRTIGKNTTVERKPDLNSCAGDQCVSNNKNMTYIKLLNKFQDLKSPETRRRELKDQIRETVNKYRKTMKLRSESFMQLVTDSYTKLDALSERNKMQSNHDRNDVFSSSSSCSYASNRANDSFYSCNEKEDSDIGLSRNNIYAPQFSDSKTFYSNNCPNEQSNKHLHDYKTKQALSTNADISQHLIRGDENIVKSCSSCNNGFSGSKDIDQSILVEAKSLKYPKDCTELSTTDSMCTLSISSCSTSSSSPSNTTLCSYNQHIDELLARRACTGSFNYGCHRIVRTISSTSNMFPFQTGSSVDACSEYDKNTILSNYPDCIESYTKTKHCGFGDASCIQEIQKKGSSVDVVKDKNQLENSFQNEKLADNLISLDSPVDVLQNGSSVDVHHGNNEGFRDFHNITRHISTESKTKLHQAKLNCQDQTVVVCNLPMNDQLRNGSSVDIHENSYNFHNILCNGSSVDLSSDGFQEVAKFASNTSFSNDISHKDCPGLLCNTANTISGSHQRSFTEMYPSDNFEFQNTASFLASKSFVNKYDSIHEIRVLGTPKEIKKYGTPV